MREVSRPTRMNMKDHNDVYTFVRLEIYTTDCPHLLRAQRDLSQEGTLNICRYYVLTLSTSCNWSIVAVPGKKRETKMRYTRCYDTCKIIWNSLIAML